MLSYMVPSLEEKPPPGPNKDRLQLSLTNGQLTNGHSAPPKKPGVSTESSASSLSSGGEPPSSSNNAQQTSTQNSERPKPKLLNGVKHTTLKRVSFGSSKGSMVETLIYESPLQEEAEGSPTPTSEAVDPETGKAPSKVRVTFFESEKPLVVSSPEQSDDLDVPTPTLMASAAVVTNSSPLPGHTAPRYDRQASTDSGWDNPFRPDGDLSREADEIVELIKGGKPITPTPGAVKDQPSPVEENGALKTQADGNLSQSPVKGANGNVSQTGGNKPVELQRGTVVPPSDGSQVEHIVLKKKPKCKCCVIQ